MMVLTERQQRCRDHIKQAKERGVSFSRCYRELGLTINTCYSIRHGLVRKGVIGRRTTATDYDWRGVSGARSDRP
ncbi:MAG: hypothetical protein QOI16_4657 [Pseudonocardiales bacterium]|jgi:hypothetical protein|nr:hypothetical protein [Pseudonocardiales bacterium]